MDARDLALEILADSDTDLRVQVTSLELDVATLREMVATSIDVIHNLTGRLDRANAALRDLLDAREADDEADA